MFVEARIFVVILIRSLVSADLSKLKCPPAPSDCILNDTDNYTSTDFIKYFSVNGNSLKVKLTHNEEVEYTCGETLLTIDDKSLPVFDSVVNFSKVTFEDCGRPAGSYAAGLATLNITGFDHLSLSFYTCDDNINFTKDQFIGLEDMQTFSILCSTNSLTPINFAFLESLTNLKRLILKRMIIPSLPQWNRINGIELHDIEPVHHSQSWGGCDVLEELIVTNWKAVSLPEGWLSRCSRLTVLNITHTKMNLLPKRMIASNSLLILKINMELKDLPQDLLTHAKNLRILDLSHNDLGTIDRSILAAVTALEELHLTDNKDFKSKMLFELTSLKRLRSLSIDRTGYYLENCNFTTDNDSVIRDWPILPLLQRLVITGECLCEAWTESMPSLRFIKLNGMPFNLTYQEVQLIRTNGWEVDLREWNIVPIAYTMSDYVRALSDSNTVCDNLYDYNPTCYRKEDFIEALNDKNAAIWIKSPLNCICEWYWFAKLLKDRPKYVLLPDLECHGGQLDGPVLFEDMPPENFSCKVNDIEPGCVGYRRVYYDNTTRVNCNGAKLDHLPRVYGLREINMANNHLKTFNVSDFNEPLTYMDLRYNQLVTVDSEIASVMFNRPSMTYHLEGNLISCSCGNSAFINALQNHQHQVKDYKKLTCNNDGLPIDDVNTFTQCLKEHVLGTLGIIFGFVAVLLLISLYIYCRYQNQIRVILYSWGWCSCWVNELELDKDKTYDVFVSFANEDSIFVMNELLPGLEKKPDGFTVCVHYRDWMPGEWIPTQIAQSVEQSRRTIIVLSESFLSSIWALLEFRTAHIQALKDRRIRLIIVLLDDVTDDARMDDELRAYLSTNTYIRRGDPRFWNKLRYALPHRQRDEKRLRAAGEAVLKRARPGDPPAGLRMNTLLRKK